MRNDNDNDASVQPTLWGEVAEHAGDLRPPPGCATPAPCGFRSERVVDDRPGRRLSRRPDADRLLLAYERLRADWFPRVGKHVRWPASTVIAWTLELEHQK